MDKLFKNKLKNLNKDELVDLLLDVADRNEIGIDKIHRKISNQKENLQVFKSRVEELKETRGYVSWRGSSSFAYELQDLLEYIPRSSTSAEEGLKLVIEFIEADKNILEAVDDSSGYVGGVFSSEVADLFVKYAKDYADKDKLVQIVVELTENDDYSVREFLITQADEYLEKKELKSLFNIAYEKYKQCTERNYHWSWIVDSLARKLKDAPFYENLIKEMKNGELRGQDFLSIASAYFDCEDYKTAQSFVDKVSLTDSFNQHRRDELQKDIFRKTNDKEGLIKILNREFNEHFSEYTLKALLEVIGESEKERICEGAINKIINEKKLDTSNAEFLLHLEAFDELENYILKNSSSLDGDYYGELYSIAEALSEEKRYIAASLIFRSLLDSILRRTKSKAYHYAVDYLKTLDKLDEKIDSWNGYGTHKAYFENLKVAHKRKYSFWNQYKDA